MRRPLALALAAAALAACSTSPCQKLGEKLCGCTGQASSTCTTQVQDQLNRINPSQDVLDQCQRMLDRCVEPAGTLFCEWLDTAAGAQACGVAPEPQPVTTTAP